MKLYRYNIKIQGFNDIITNSSTSVVVRYDRKGVYQLKDLVNSLIKPFTVLTFDDLFELYYIYEDPDTGEKKELYEYEKDIDLDKILEDSWNNVVWDGGFPSISEILIKTKKGKESLDTAAYLLKNIALFFETETISD